MGETEAKKRTLLIKKGTNKANVTSVAKQIPRIISLIHVETPL
jgi:hypothetical protein